MSTRIHTRNYEYNQTIYNVNKPSLSFTLDESFLYVSTIKQKCLFSRTLVHALTYYEFCAEKESSLSSYLYSFVNY